MKWGIAGYGHFAPKFVESLAGIYSEEVYAIATRSGQERAKADYPDAVIYTAYEELFADRKVDIVYVCTTHNAHKSLVIGALEAGKHVICEKPMGVSAAETGEMIQAAKREGKFLMEAMWTRYLPAYRSIRERVRKGEIGELMYLTANFGFKSDLPPERRLLNPALAGGALYDLGVYPIALATDFLGAPDEVHANAVRARTGVDEHISITMHYKDGKSAHLFSSIGLDSSNQARLYGTEGTIIMDLFWKVQHFAVVINGHEQWHEMPYKRTGYVHEIIDALERVENGDLEPSLITHADSLLSARIVDRLRSMTGLG